MRNGFTEKLTDAYGWKWPTSNPMFKVPEKMIYLKLTFEKDKLFNAVRHKINAAWGEHIRVPNFINYRLSDEWFLTNANAASRSFPPTM